MNAKKGMVVVSTSVWILHTPIAVNVRVATPSTLMATAAGVCTQILTIPVVKALVLCECTKKLLIDV